jgi:hypothetical protein
MFYLLAGLVVSILTHRIYIFISCSSFTLFLAHDIDCQGMFVLFCHGTTERTYFSLPQLAWD